MVKITRNMPSKFYRDFIRVYGYMVSGVRREERRSGNAKPRETTPKWNGFLMIKLAAFQASGGARMKLHIVATANRRMSNIEPQNVEGWNRFAQSF